MAIKVYKLGLGSNSFSLILPSGLNLSGATALMMVIKKPNGTEISKVLGVPNIVSGTNNISISVSADMTDVEGIYDYNIINTTSSKYEIGPILQYFVSLSIT